LRWWAESASPGWDRVKVSENLGATAVALVAPADTSLNSISRLRFIPFFLKLQLLLEKKCILCHYCNYSVHTLSYS
jgi:hypothetical protein